ncbi:glycoside hydrolase family 3 N-terminal domain-containing protein [Acuticoccus sp. MNP-M23]|uniref:glycoside hydrolase family 3 N-terminal domain-containing protein n=1 Tax=Acuticoccus sp. MNP-M23 TaxID=3072793 RepID=UPI0028160C9E|nr:glycoside hydrolase family 3 N-terminal domain-containing protein [Acuticoccus sp. MNP-M23]WMS42627.1 glycoside hydrolase family 3 N-terminal domain-containing protein [Acuticoccus sp. MNP-M23]
MAVAVMPATPIRRAASAVLAASLTLTAVPAFAQARIPWPPIDGLIERPEDFVAVPQTRPAHYIVPETDCKPADPALSWTRLPRPLRELSLRQMIGQLLVVSYSGSAPDSAGVAIAQDALRRSEIGGVLTFRHNIKSADETRGVNEILVAANPLLPAMIAVDQEGGAVMRLRPSEGGPDTPSAADVAEGSIEDARKTYNEMAEALADLGFNANFGPVVDLSINPNNPVIAQFGRAYGDDPETVERYAEAFIDAHHAAGVATALKHFPGHGSSRADSHIGAIDLTSTWSPVELEPFQALIDEDEADMVMIGHLELDGVTGPGDLPASLSPVAIQTILRDTFCFDGVVVSDDLAMDAVEKRWGSADAARLMIEAGGDIALLSLSADKGMKLVTEITDSLAAKAEASPEFAAKIRYAYARVANHKLDLAERQRKAAASGAASSPAEPSAATQPD